MKPEDTKRLQELAQSAKDASEEKLNAICRDETQIVFGPYLFHPDGHERDWKEMCDVPSAALRNVAVVNAAINSSLGDFDLHPTLAKLRIPVLVIEGEKTNVPLDSTREWAKTPPNARLLLIPDAGHATFVDQPNVLLREIEIFLQGSCPTNSKKTEKS